MKNEIVAKVMGNKFISKVVGEIGRFYINNESIILTTGTIGFGWAAVGVALKNASEINYILENCKDALRNCNTKEERNQVYSIALRSLAPLILPIFIFEGASTACALVSKKQYDKKLAEAAGALSIAQAAIAQYQSFQKETEKALGEEAYAHLQDDIYKNMEIDGRRFTALASEGAPGDTLFIDKYSGRPFWDSYGRIDNATERIQMRISKNGGYDQVSINDWYEEIGNSDLKPNILGDNFGYLARVNQANISVRYSDTHYIFPNGTRVQAAEVYLSPEPDYIG